MTKRWTAVLALVTRLQGITPGNGYTFDLSQAGTCTAGIETRLQRLEGPIDVQVQIEEGEESVERPEISPGKLTRANLELVADAMIRGHTATDFRERLNTLLGEINRRLHEDETLANTVQRAYVVRVDPPAYSPEERLAFVAIRILCVYYYKAGSTI